MMMRMRTKFHDQLDVLTDRLALMCHLAGEAIGVATDALVQADLSLAERVFDLNEQIEGARGERPARGAAGDLRLLGRADRHPDRRQSVAHPLEGTVLAFETGNITASTRTGWSVLTIGRARLFAGTDGLDGFDDPTRSPVERLCRRLLPPHRHRLAQRPPHHPAPPHR